MERWYSPELQTDVMRKETNPQFGETTFQLTNIVRAEPQASLFQVPSTTPSRADEPRVMSRRQERRRTVIAVYATGRALRPPSVRSVRPDSGMPSSSAVGERSEAGPAPRRTPQRQSPCHRLFPVAGVPSMTPTL